MAEFPSEFLFFPQDWRRLLASLYTAEALRLRAAYERRIARLEQAQGELESALAELERRGGLTAQAVRDLAETTALIGLLSEEMVGFSRFLDDELASLSAGALELGARAAEEMALTAAGRASAVVSASWRRPDLEMLARLVRYAESDGMKAGLARFGDASAAAVRDTLLTLSAQGKGSRTIAAALRNAYAVPLSWAENMARTAQAWSYRGASHASYRANSDVVTGWVWVATLDARTCVSCIGQHGSRHGLEEELNDHHSGRCSAAPVVVGTRLYDGMRTGPQWFNAQPEAVQRGIMGPGMFDAYKRGAFAWSDVSVTYQDAVYGRMRRAATLKELLR